MWNKDKLKNITKKIGSGATPTGGKGAYKKQGISLIRSMNVYDFYFNDKDLAFINEKQAAKLNNVTVQEKDVLLNITGASVARCCMVPNKILPARVNQHVSIVRADNINVDSKFLFYSLVSPKNKSELLAISQAGATREALTKERIEEFEISLPPHITTQRKIAFILSNYDDLIENNNRRIKILEEMAQAIYKEWFIDFNFPGYEDVEFEDSELGRKPKRWEIKTLGSFIAIPKGKNITKKTIKEGTIPVVAGGITPAYYHNKPNAKSPVITISASGANAGYVKLYQENIWASDCSYIDNSVTDFVYFYYLLLTTRQTEVTRLQRGAAQPHVYPKDLMELKTIEIPDHLIEKFEVITIPLFDLLSNLKKKNSNLTKTRDMLLPKLISGEVDVSILEINY